MNIYVGNLPRNLSESELRQAFENFGEVSTVSIIKDKFSGQSRGFGFIEMPNREEAERAIAALNGQDLKGRALTVNEARPRADRPKNQGFFGRRGGRSSFGGRR
ncbi:MAG: RNA-binding protein [Candidatus Aminicenantes bacterium]|nr:RNA-binding protein [Candidatus Aminicenantes bacterium]